MPKLEIFKLSPAVELPKIETTGSACFDIKMCLGEAKAIKCYDDFNRSKEADVRIDSDGIEYVVIHPGQRYLLPTGMIFKIPEGYSLRIHSRSSMAWKQGLILPNSEGIIDSDYFHETFMMVLNTSQVSVVIKNGERICQAELVETLDIDISETKTKPSQTTTRTGGFGSTGKN